MKEKITKVISTILSTIIVILSVFLLVKNILFFEIIVVGTSMDSTLKEGEMGFAIKDNFVINIDREDIIIFEKDDREIIKRVIGVAGDHIEIKDNKIFVNGTELKEEYLPENTQTKSEVFTDFVVPEGHIFAVGDNRDHSVDCREFGCIPLEKIEGTVICRFWPLNQISGF